MEIPFYARNIFSSFSPEERQSVFQIMGNVMMVDGVADYREKAVINEICEVMGLTDTDVAKSRTLSKDFMTNVIRRMPDEKKFLVARAISTIALADGKVLGVEESFVQYLAKELKLNVEWF